MIHLIVDSTFGIEKDYAKQKGIEIVNLKLILNDQVFEEGTQECWNQFYTKLESSKEFFTTSQPSPEDFKNSIEKILKKDHDAEIIILTISNALSGTINAATIASKMFKNNKIIAIDSKTCSAGGRIMVEEVVSLIEQGNSFDQVIQTIKELQEKITVEFIPDTMEYLKKGGRVGAISATIASILKIKPIFLFKNGMVIVRKKVIGFTRAVGDMISQIPQNFKKLYLLYIHDDSNVDLLKQKVFTTLNVENTKIVPVSPVFGAHVGIGAIGIAVL